MSRPLPNFLRPLRHDVLVVSVTVWTSGQTTDNEGNVVNTPEGTPVVLDGWDIQPIPTIVPVSFSPSGAAEVPNARRGFGPVEHAPYLGIGKKMKNNKTGEEYRISNFQNWGSHLEIYLEVSD